MPAVTVRSPPSSMPWIRSPASWPAATVLGDKAVAAVDRAGIEDADAAGKLGNELGDGDCARQHEVDTT
jgi:hypothetical protein